MHRVVYAIWMSNSCKNVCIKYLKVTLPLNNIILICDTRFSSELKASYRVFKNFLPNYSLQPIPQPAREGMLLLLVGHFLNDQVQPITDERRVANTENSSLKKTFFSEHPVVGFRALSMDLVNLMTGMSRFTPFNERRPSMWSYYYFFAAPKWKYTFVFHLLIKINIDDFAGEQWIVDALNMLEWCIKTCKYGQWVTGPRI